MSRRTLLLLALATALACGRKARPVAPELVLPETPDDLTAVAVPEGVRLSWGRPEHYTSGGKMNDLDAFIIERAPGEGVDTAKYSRVGKYVIEDRFRFRKEHRLEWVDHDATAGQRYLYKVTAVTLDRYRSAPAGPVAVRFGPAPAGSEPAAAPEAAPKPEPKAQPVPPPPADEDQDDEDEEEEY